MNWPVRKKNQRQKKIIRVVQINKPHRQNWFKIPKKKGIGVEDPKLGLSYFRGGLHDRSADSLHLKV
jgi:hypothetical protein